MTIYTALMYSFPDLEPVCCSMSSSNCCFLTCIQVSQEGGKVVWYSHLFQNFPQFVVIHTFKGFSIVNKAEVLLFPIMKILKCYWRIKILKKLRYIPCSSIGWLNIIKTSALFILIYTPVFLPRKSHGQRSLVSYSPWGHKRVRHNLDTKQQQR